MRNPDKIHTTKSTVYAASWLIYMSFTLMAFPAFSITVMLFSIALSMVGAWLYRYPGWMATTALTIPYHYIMLVYCSDDPKVWIEAFNPFGISTQLCISGVVAILRSKKQQLDSLNRQLEERIESRKQELNRLSQYVVENREAQRVHLVRTVLGDIGAILSEMLRSSLEIRLARQNNESEENQLATIQALLRKSLDLMQNPEHADYFLEHDEGNLARATQELANNFKQTGGACFELVIDERIEGLPSPEKHLLYRIIHESVTNAIRHAKATLVKITITREEHTYQLTVVNTGCPMPAQVTMGLGLSLMRYRAHQLQGTITFDNTPDGQTRVCCTIPLSTNRT